MNTLLKSLPRALIASVLITACMVAAHASNSEVAKTRETLKSWVEAEQTLSSERVNWLEEKVTMGDLITVLSKETATLKDAISHSEASLSQADEERDALLKQREQMREQRAHISAFLTRTEAQVRRLRERLPKPLVEKLAPLYKQLPSDPEETSLGIAERMQRVLAILDSVRAFDRKLSVHHEMRERPDGKLQEVTTLYIGLAQAFYVNGDEAGIGYPTSSGWSWEERKELADDVQRAVNMIEGSTHTIEYVPLPLNLTERVR